ncbi:MAG: TIR domain-containing protein [Halomonas sp.]|nr:TIR domain-containing protein [Halomonas sp.]MBP5981143.1 TIR domain-containing protein [Halomonas sp.]
MKVFISYTHQDKKYAELIADRLRNAGHDVWYDGWKLKAGDNLVEKINHGLKETDALVVILSKNALQSKWVMHEFSALAFGELSGKTNRIIPVLVDKSTVPEYLARYVYVDLSDNTEIGLNGIVRALSAQPTTKPILKSDRKRSYEKAVDALSDTLHEGRLTLVCGAGVSIDAGIPSWNALLLRLLDRMMSRISQNHSISFKDVDPLEFQRRYGPSALVVGRYLKSNLGNDFMPELREALYSDDPTSCDIIEAIAELARPQRDGRPLDSIVTFNFDGLTEEALTNSNIRHKAIHEEGIRVGPNELPIYHVHGYLPRKGKIKKETDIVFSEEAYHSQFIDPFSWSNLTQLNKLSQNTCLFLGLSLTDPNLRRLLDVAHRKNPSRQLNHYIIKKVPSFSGKNDTVDDLALLLEEQDANELGLNVVWIGAFNEVAPLLRRIAGDQE